MRVRFVNIRGKSEKWHDIAIAPVMDQLGHKIGKEELRKARLHIFQRFSFKIYEELIEDSRDGVMLHDGTIIGVRVVMLVCD